MKKIGVLLLDDHLIFRQGLVRLLDAEADLDMRLHTGTIVEALTMLAAGGVDVVLLDLDLGPSRGIDFLVQARRSGFLGPVLVLAAEISPQDKDFLAGYGVSGMLSKNVSATEVAEHIRSAAGRNMPPIGAKSSGTPARAEFTEREAVVLRLVWEGLGNKEIGVELGCSETAVKGILQQLFRKTGTHMRAQLVRFVLEHCGGRI